MTPEQDLMVRESHANSIAALKSATRVEEFWFGKPEDQDKPHRKPTRADKIDNLLFGIAAGRLSIRVIMGVSAFLIAIGGAFAMFKGLSK